MGFQAAGADCMNDPKIKSWEGNIGGSLVCKGRFKARRFRPRNPRNRSYCSSMSLKLPQNGCHAQPNTCVYLRFPKICSLCLSEGTGASVDRSFCEDCAEGYFGLGGSCTICPNGTEPVLGQNVSCGPCPPTTAGTLGVCMQCPDGTQQNAERTACESPAFVRFHQGSGDVSMETLETLMP